MEGPKVSIIMGVYNCSNYLPNAIDSILKQSYQNWELIMCNDGSTDDTLSVAKAYAKKYDNIFVLNNDTNRRLAYSLNHCLKYAKGEYIARMDADDESLPERLAIQVKHLEDHPNCDVVGTALQIRDGDLLTYVRRYPEYPMRQEVWSTVPFAHPTILMRKKTMDCLNGYRDCKETMRAEDLDLWFRFKEQGFNGYNIQEPLYIYQESLIDYRKRSLEAAIQTSKILAKYYKRLDIQKKYWFLILKPIVASLLPNTVMKWYHKRISTMT